MVSLEQTAMLCKVWKELIKSKMKMNVEWMEAMCQKYFDASSHPNHNQIQAAKL